jgi:hypothetical protein
VPLTSIVPENFVPAPSPLCGVGNQVNGWWGRRYTGVTDSLSEPVSVAPLVNVTMNPVTTITPPDRFVTVILYPGSFTVAVPSR